MLFSRYQGFLTSLPGRKKYEHSDLLVSDLLIAEEGRLRVFYAPFDWANPDARVIILGITPGWTQMEIACREARAALSSGGSAEDVCRSAKSLVDLPAAKKSGEVLKHNIKVAADAGIDCLKYNVQMVGITRTGLKPGRGGAHNSGFVFAEYFPESDRKHSYWGVGYPTNQAEPSAPGRLKPMASARGGQTPQAGGPVEVMGDAESAMLCGQKMAREVPTVSAADGWRAIEFLVEGLVPAADVAGVRLACHPHDPAYPIGGLNGIEHVVGSADGIRKFLSLSSSRNHGLNFCQGTVAEMFTEPGNHMIPVIEEFASTGRIFMVHFRNIRGGYLDFQEVFPDEGDIDMFEAIKAYQRGGYKGPLCPDHVPVSEFDENRERFMSFALGYTRGLLQAAGVWSTGRH